MLSVKDKKNFDYRNINLVDCLEGNALDTYFTLKIFKILEQKLDDRSLLPFYEYLISPLTGLLAEIEAYGLLISEPELDKLDIDILTKLDSILSEIHELDEIREEDNLASTINLMRILFSLKKNEKKEYCIVEGVGFGMYPPHQTEGGDPATHKEALGTLRDNLNTEIHKRKL